MIVVLGSVQTFLSSDGALKQIPLSTKFGEIELQQLSEMAKRLHWKTEGWEERIAQARLMVDANWAQPKDYALLELERQGRLEMLNGIEYWTVELDHRRGVGIYLNLESYTLEVMIVNLESFSPLHRETVTTLHRLLELTSP